MMDHKPRLLLVTGLSGGGKSTILKSLEDLGWEVVDNLPLALLDALMEAQEQDGLPPRPIAVGIDSRSRGFQSTLLVEKIEQLRDAGEWQIELLFTECADAELERRFSETRRRHPLADDRPAADGIAREREMMSNLRHRAEHLIDTTNFSVHDLQQEVRHRFASSAQLEPALNILSFGFSRGIPRNADLLFDMRYLRNPHWNLQLRPGTGLDAEVAAYIGTDPAYEITVSQIEKLILQLLPRYQAEGKSYITIAIGCTGGRHRSVHVADRLTNTLLSAGYNPVLTHRNLDSRPQDGLEGQPPSANREADEENTRSAHNA